MEVTNADFVSCPFCSSGINPHHFEDHVRRVHPVEWPSVELIKILLEEERRKDETGQREKE